MTIENSTDNVAQHHCRRQYGHALIVLSLLMLSCAGYGFADQVLGAAASDLNFPIKELSANSNKRRVTP
jgi:hypothetical protein